MPASSRGRPGGRIDEILQSLSDRHLVGTLPALRHAAPTCHGRFMNPITDICWSCVFPLTIGSAALLSDGQDDIANPSSPVCYCSNPPRIGVSIGFWEPERLVDVTRTPFCMVGLGGIHIDPGIHVPRGAQVGHDSQTRNSFYHVHWYTNPILYWLEILLDSRV
jgi:conjugal transfer pilus assembly protein TraU